MKPRSLIAIITAVTALSSASAFAADMPVKAPPPVVVPPPFSWTGFYIGGHVGGAKVERCLTLTVVSAEACADKTGFLGGGQVGVNWQTGQFVFGVEFSGSFADFDSDVSAGTLPGGVFFNSHGRSLLMLTGRLGWAADRALFYVTGGGAQARASVDFFTPAGSALEVHFSRTGWTIGAGFEYAFTPNWSFAAQYNFVDLGDRDVVFATTPPVAASLSHDIHVVTLRLNYRFGWAGAPVAARY
jgi:outer membrane immunogenic protein